MYKETTLQRIKRHEDFREKPYPDPIHGWKVPTFGYGFTYITKQEAEPILRNRIQTITAELRRRLSFFRQLPEDIQSVLVEMAYQLGIPGLLKFRKTLKFLALGQYSEASEEMLDSKWAKKDTPRRARELAEIVRRTR